MSDRNLSRHPILRAIYDASQAIERCGASPELTHAAVLTAALSEHAAALLDERDALQAKIDLLCAPVSPSNLRDLGAFLANLLDEDRWPAAERRLNAALSERASLIAERDDLAHDVKRHLAIVASVEAERDAAIRRAEALAVVLRDARAAIAPPSVVFAAGYPLPAHLRMTAERAQLLGRIDAVLGAARAEEER